VNLAIQIDIDLQSETILKPTIKEFVAQENARNLAASIRSKSSVRDRSERTCYLLTLTLTLILHQRQWSPFSDLIDFRQRSHFPGQFASTQWWFIACTHVQRHLTSEQRNTE